jgi:hypothetical protein
MRFVGKQSARSEQQYDDEPCREEKIVAHKREGDAVWGTTGSLHWKFVAASPHGPKSVQCGTDLQQRIPSSPGAAPAVQSVRLGSLGRAPPWHRIATSVPGQPVSSGEQKGVSGVPRTHVPVAAEQDSGAAQPAPIPHASPSPPRSSEHAVARATRLNDSGTTMHAHAIARMRVRSRRDTPSG